jgi:hypothetical protein
MIDHDVRSPVAALVLGGLFLAATMLCTAAVR